MLFKHKCYINVFQSKYQTNEFKNVTLLLLTCCCFSWGKQNAVMVMMNESRMVIKSEDDEEKGFGLEIYCAEVFDEFMKGN